MAELSSGNARFGLRLALDSFLGLPFLNIIPLKLYTPHEKQKGLLEPNFGGAVKINDNAE